MSLADSRVSGFDNKDCEIVKLNLLAFPRDVTPICELTGSKATVQLVTPHCSFYYANEECAQQSWFGILKKIVHLLPPLLQSPPIVGTQEERAKRAKALLLNKKSLAEYCLTEASNLLSVRKFQLAKPAALQALKFFQDLDGERAVSTSEPYLQLGQSALGMQDIKKAEEFLSLANWIILNNEVSDKTRSKFHVLLGRVFVARGDFESAKSEFASCIFYASKYYGAESITTSMGYFRLGDTFLALGNVEVALDFYDKVVDIWYKYLTKLYSVQSSTNKIETKGILSLAVPNKPDTKAIEETDMNFGESLTEEEIADGRSQLAQILDNRRRILGNRHIAIGEVQYTLGLFEYLILNSDNAASTFTLAALEAYESNYGLDHLSTKHVAAVHELINSNR